MIKVLYDHQIFSNQRYGGISRYFKYLMDGIEDADDVVYILGVFNSDNEYIQKDRQLSKWSFSSLFNTKRKQLTAIMLTAQS